MVRSIRAAFLAAFSFLTLASCAMDLAPMGIPLGTVTLSSPERDTGGVILERAAELAAIRVAAQRRPDLPYERRIVGECLSACTLYIADDLKPFVCFEPDALLGFHGPNNEAGTISDRERAAAAQVMASFYPPRIREWFLAGPARGDAITIIPAADLIARGEIRACA